MDDNVITTEFDEPAEGEQPATDAAMGSGGEDE